MDWFEDGARRRRAEFTREEPGGGEAVVTPAAQESRFRALRQVVRAAWADQLAAVGGWELDEDDEGLFEEDLLERSRSPAPRTHGEGSGVPESVSGGSGSPDDDSATQ